MDPRIVVSGATLAIVRRCTMRKAFLAPWHPLVSEGWLYSLAWAQLKTQVAVHYSNLVVSHHHTDITLTKPNLGDFLQLLHRDMSCFTNTLLADQRYDAPREVFDDRATHAMRPLDAGAQMRQLVYDRLNCVAAGLVQRPEHMPGSVLDFDCWKRGSVVVKRPPLYFDPDERPAELELELTPPPLLMRAFDGDLAQLVYNMNRLTDDGARELRQARSYPVLGAQKVQRLHPWSEPRTLRESGGKRVPSFRIGVRGIDGAQMFRAAAEEKRDFAREHRDSRLAHCDGDHRAPYPFGTYNARVRLNRPVEPEPKDTALLTKPGPLLHDVIAETAQRKATRATTQEEQHAAHATVVELATQMRQAIIEDASQLVNEEAQRFDDQGTPAAHNDVGGGRLERVVLHRFDRRDNHPATAPRRIVTLRDARHGRLKRSSGKHGVDPPV